MDELADRQGVSAPVLRMRRVRAERTLLAALARGQVRDARLTVRSTRSAAAQAQLDGLTPARPGPAAAGGNAVTPESAA